MKIEFKNLLEGITNTIWVKEEVEKLSQERLLHCVVCPHYSPNVPNLKVTRVDKFCIDCGCNMYLKSRSPSAKCSLGGPDSHFPTETPKWWALVDNDQDAEKILNTLELKKQLDDYKINLMHNKAE